MSLCRIAPLAAAWFALAGAWAAEGPSVAWDKVHPRVITDGARGDVEFLIVLGEQADLEAARRLHTKDAKGRAVVERLQEVATRTQAPLLAWLESRGVEHRAFWIVNMIWARADLETVGLLAARTEVQRIDANPRVRLDRPPAAASVAEPLAPDAIEWNVLKIKADQVWALGYDGTGIVVGSCDTGFDWDHPALKAKYRGWNGASVNHAYNWHDAIHSGGGVCGANSPAPCDDAPHGTHTMGTTVGSDGGSNQIGVAPGARWMGCRNMDEGDGTPATYTECFQFMLAPTNAQGANPDPSKAPHVINNSWGCLVSEGCSANTIKAIVETVRAAGIVVVASAGNSGPDCSTIEEPPAIYEAAFTVGSTDSSDKIAGSSSRGPVEVDGSHRLKPDVSAPGVDVRSSVPGTGYDVFSGTSMAAPHVTGLIALLLDARPDLIGRVETIEELIRRSAKPLTSSKNCGGFPGSQVPNPIFGHGRIDALEVFVGDADDDGVDNLDDCAPVNGQISEPPSDVDDLVLKRSGATVTLTWSAPPGGVTYDVLRSPSPSDFSAATCLVTDASATTTSDAAPSSGLRSYLVRAQNECGETLGVDSDGTPRTGAECPP